MPTKGIRALQRVCRDFPDEVEKAMAAAVVAEVRDIWDDERSWVPVVSGELQGGIRIRYDDDLHATVGIFDPALFWAVWIEWGRKNAKAQPFATPAAEAARRRWPRRAEQTLRRIADRA